MYSINFLYLSLVFITNLLYEQCHLTLNTTEVGGSLFLYLSLGDHFSFYRINQAINFTYVNNYNKANRSNEDIYIEQVKEKGEPIADILKGNESNVSEFMFYNVPTATKHYLPGNQIGLGFNFNNENYSMVHKLKNQSLIAKNEYTIVPGDNSFNGQMFIGELLDEEMNKYSFKTTCKVNSNSSLWGCNLDSVYYGDISFVFNNTKYDNEYPMHFQISEEFTLAPASFMSFLEHKVFDSLLKSGQCGFIEGVYDYFECYHDSIDTITKSFSFKFSDSVLMLNKKDVFKCSLNKCKFVIMGNRRVNEWVFGNSFMNHFAITFDYEDKDITFYSNEYNIKVINLENSFRLVGLAKKMTVISLFFILFALIKLYRYHYLHKRVIKKKKKKKGIELL